MDVIQVKKEPIETLENPLSQDDPGSDLVSIIKCEDYQLTESHNSIPLHSEAPEKILCKDDPGSDLVSIIKCEDYQLTESHDSIPLHSEVSSKPEAPTSNDRSSGSEGNLHCPECNKSYRSANALRMHRRRIHNLPTPKERSPGPDIKLYCPECNKSCSSPNAVRLHRRRIHNLPTLKERRIHQLPEPVERPLLYRCKQCDKTFQSHKKLREHQRYHDTVQCQECKKSIARVYLKEHIAGHAGTFRCELCHKTFSSYRSLQLHKNLLHDANPSEEHACPECDQMFSNAAQLIFHRRTHLQVECPVCKKMRSKAFIKDHIASHEGAYRCKVCDGTFCSNSGLIRHMKTKHKPDKKTVTITDREDGKLRCEQCDQHFDSKRQLRVHRFSHKKVPCTICCKMITQKNFKEHLALHTYRS